MNKRLFAFLPLLLCMPLAGCSGAEDGTTQLPPNNIETFKNARNNTVNTNQYQYDFEVSAKIKFKDAVNFSPATYSGTTYYNSDAAGTNFLQVRNITGALVIDSTNYIYNVGTDLIKISADEDKDFSVINHESIQTAQELDKNNFSYILKTLNDDHFIKINVVGDKYDISLKTDFSQDSLLGILNFIDSNIILKALSAYTKSEWGVGFEVNTWATLDSTRTHLNTFHFDASVNIKDVLEVSFLIEQRFTKYIDVTITLPTFTNTIVEESAVNNELASINQVYTSSKKAATSYYTFDVKTAVDHGVSKTNPLGLAVNSRTQGKAKRQLIADKVYFNNRLEVDSDYKNKDQYGDLVKDYDSYRARLNDGTDSVYDVLDPKIGSNQYKKLSDYSESAIDEYYMLPDQSLFSFNNIKVLKKSTDDSGNTTYKFGLSGDAVNTILAQYNSAIRIDFTRETIFDIYKIKSNFVAKKALFTLTINSANKLTDINIDLKGFYTEKDSEDQVKFRLQNKISFDWTKTYTAATTKEDIDN